MFNLTVRVMLEV